MGVRRGFPRIQPKLLLLPPYYELLHQFRLRTTRNHNGTRYHHWHEDLAPALNWHFWSRKGILPILLSFKLGRPVGSGSASAYEVLAAALNRGQHGRHPLRRLFLLAWQAYQPPTTGKQAATVNRFMEYLDNGAEADRQYDAFVSILFPGMRHLLRR